MKYYGAKISKTDKDANSTNPNDFIFNSRYGSAIIYKEETRDVTIPASSTVYDIVNFYYPDNVTPITFPHIPVIIITAKLNNSNTWYINPFTFTETLFNDSDMETIILGDYPPTGLYTYIENDKFKISFRNKTSSSKTIKYRYYILINLAVV